MDHYSESDATVFVVDDDHAVRESICDLMRAHGLSVRGFSDAWTFLEAVDEQSRGCVVLDVRMPGLSGLGLQKALNARGVELPVIIVTGHGDAETAITAMKHGAVDFLCKPFRGAELLRKVREALDEDAERRESQRRRVLIRERLARLNPGERAVLEAVVEGKPNKVIARELHVSLSTVEARRRRIREKLGTGNLSVLVRMVDSERVGG
ncbi:response regulator transcription factor [Alkalilimnicola ehrlichii MLHE-1]|uniref:Two component transcriptional regulator, LuxR family n=1 Tax=Alkalilimnicola ehrlichii (strain ATCC BAA-1101 / DSM 17681 / MLHE-1) TaxID=187272 RepID=Q0A7L1_ALKEH|nr:response regulator [Alkalilimnicola ehrlichii]ABI57176.1 two component transcriptional regulator, LuxR family [Alkalilimnicola ehrlichii MLHE-1]